MEKKDYKADFPWRENKGLSLFGNLKNNKLISKTPDFYEE